MRDELSCTTCGADDVCLPDCPGWRYRFGRVLEAARDREYLDSVIAESKQRLARIMDLEDVVSQLQEALAMSASIIRSGESMSPQAHERIYGALTRAREVMK